MDDPPARESEDVTSPQRALRRSRPLRAVPTDAGVQIDRAGSFDDVLPAAQAGGEWALAVLYQRHDGAIRRYLRARAGDDGDDIASQTWLDAARNLSAFSGDEDAFRGWLFTIARRRLIDHGRRRSRRREVLAEDEVLAGLEADDDPATTTAEQLAGDDAARRIVELLPAAQAEVVLLRVVAGLDVAEVAEITGQRPGTVRVMQHRALKRLATELAEEQRGEDG